MASTRYGKPDYGYYTFDEATKIDLAGTGVKVLDVYQLLAKYICRNPDISKEGLQALTVYDLANDLIDAAPKASFFFDECPFIGVSTKWYEIGGKMKFLMNNRSIAKKLIVHPFIHHYKFSCCRLFIIHHYQFYQ